MKNPPYQHKILKERIGKVSAVAILMALALYASPAFPQASVTQTTQTQVTTTKNISSRPISGASMERVTTTVENPQTSSSKTRWMTEERAITPVGARLYNILDFDLNGDLILSINEVGEKLFKMYDTDGNGMVDNIEYDRRAVLTVTPIEKNTTVSYDFDGDGNADKIVTTSDVFLERTQLSRFDTNSDGLSPREFTNRSFMEADIDNDKFVNMKEWKGSYTASIDVKNKADASFN